MKLRSAAVITCIIFLSACTRTLDHNDPANVAVSGTWRVTLFTDSGNDETSDFSGFSFSFNSNGTVSATRSGVTKSGTWSTASNKFTIDLGAKIDTNKPLGELTDNWQIISISANEIKLTDDNVASAEFLTFTKN